MNNRTILIVDDEADILRVLERGLTQDGFHVKTARSADAAIQTFTAMSPRPDLLIADVVMPGMSGPMLAERLRTIEPGLRILFMSGYDSTNVVRRYVVERGFSLMAKPFTVAALKVTIQAVLEAPKAAVQESGS
jgi:DNA-binding NtrC family response regulator